MSHLDGPEWISIKAQERQQKKLYHRLNLQPFLRIGAGPSGWSTLWNLGLPAQLLQLYEPGPCSNSWYQLALALFAGWILPDILDIVPSGLLLFISFLWHPLASCWHCDFFCRQAYTSEALENSQCLVLHTKKYVLKELNHIIYETVWSTGCSQEISPAIMSHRPRSHVTKKLSMSATGRWLFVFAAQGSPLEGEHLAALGPKSGPVTISLCLVSVTVTTKHPLSTHCQMPHRHKLHPYLTSKKYHLCFTIITHISSCRIMTADNIKNKFQIMDQKGGNWIQ